MKIITLVSLLILTGCAANPPNTQGGTFIRKEVTLIWVNNATLKFLSNVCKNPRAIACAFIPIKATDKCIILTQPVPTPLTHEYLRILGHEAAHCFLGAYHD